MEAPLVGGEQEVLALILQRHRVGRRTERTVGTHIVVVRLEVVADVHRVAIRARQRGLRVIPAGSLRRTAGRGAVHLVRHHHLDAVFVQRQHAVHQFLTRIVDVQVHVVFRAFDGEVPAGIRRTMHGAGKEHHRGAFQRASLLIHHAAFHYTVFGHSDVIVAHLAFHYPDRIIRSCKRSGEQR